MDAEKGEASTHHRSEEVVSSQYGGCLFGIRILKVIKYTLEEQESTNGEERRADDRDDPVNAWHGGGSETKETDWKPDTAEHGNWQTSLGWQAIARSSDFGDLRLPVVDAEADICDDTTDEKLNKAKRRDISTKH